MKTILKNSLILSIFILGFAQTTFAAEEKIPAITSCLNAWGKHPFGENPKYRTLATSVKVFGIGENPKDKEITDKPELVLVSPAVNVMGGTVYELLNPNGWYCFKANVNVMGGLTIKANCKAHLASSTTGATVFGSSTDQENKGVTVMGSTKIVLIGCEDKKEETKK